MRSIRQKLPGVLFAEPARAAIWWQRDEDDEPTSDKVSASNQVVLRYALTLRGTEQPFFPAFLLDDWGNEVRKLGLYQWLRDNGDVYPRAELFGFDLQGNETQHFVREFELYYKYSCFAYPDLETSISDGVRVSHILLADETQPQLTRIKRPTTAKTPLRRVNAQWWSANSESLAAFRFSLISQ